MARTLKNFRKRMENQIVAFLSKKGEETAKKALQSVDYAAKTNNLDDSFCWGVYAHGKLVDGAYGCAQAQEATKPKTWYGKEMYGHANAIQFLRNFKPIRKGFALVVVEVMPYGEILERGWNKAKSGKHYSLKRKYRVISTAVSDLQAMQPHYSGSRVRIIHRGKAQ